MLDWNDVKYFLALYRAGTLAGAAAALRINATTVGRRLGSLEEQVGARLFDRTPDRYTLTQAGRDMLRRAESIEREALALEREVTGADGRLAGVVRLASTETLATRFLAPKLPAFFAAHPDIVLELQCSNRGVSLARREADVALRLSRPHEDNVVTRKIATIDLALYASNDYFARRGMPASPDTSLRDHDLVMFADTRTFALENVWIDARRDGARVVLRSDSVSSIYSATVAGLGIALLPRTVAEREPTLRRIDTASAPEPRNVWQAVHADLQKSARIRAVLDFLATVVPMHGV
jgi:DNA-binding transcriptional LysR family regulator